MKKDDLTRFQLIQLRDVSKQIYDLDMAKLRRAIFKTFDGLEEDLITKKKELEETECLINNPLKKKIIEMEVCKFWTSV